jgi:hypothetical protein
VLTIVFQSIPAYKRHGVIVNYSIAVQELSQTVEVKGGSDIYSVQLRLPRKINIYHLNLTASTIVGPSPPESITVTMPVAGIVSTDVLFIFSSHFSIVGISLIATYVIYYINRTISTYSIDEYVKLFRRFFFFYWLSPIYLMIACVSYCHT